MGESFRFAVGCMVPIAVMGFSAFLIYKQVPGWGWYLFASALIAGSTSVKVG